MRGEEQLFTNSKGGFLRILQSIDSFFPVGGFTLSNGIEDYVLREAIHSGEELKEYIIGFLKLFPYNDLGLLSLSYQHEKDPEYLLELDCIALAMKSAREVRQGSIRMGSRYMKARIGMQDSTPMLDWYQRQVQKKEAFGFHPIALGLYGASCGIDLKLLLDMYGYSTISAIVNNTVKLVPLSQIKGQRVLLQMLDFLDEATSQAMGISMDSLGVSGTASEIHCMNHEKLYSRQYMS